jgi:hypothetical protein
VNAISGPAQRKGALRNGGTVRLANPDESGLTWWKPNGFTSTAAPQRFGVFFPSLSQTIVGEGGAVSRVRFAAQKPRALDTAPPSPNKILLSRKRREAIAHPSQRKSTLMNAGDSRTGMARGGLNGHPKLKPKTPSGISLLTTEIGLDKGVHFKYRNVSGEKALHAV